MKLYATLEGYESAKVVSKSSDERLTINLFKQNKNIGIVTVNAYTNEIVFSRRDGNKYTPVYRTSINRCGHQLCGVDICQEDLPL